jgi:hypothetical protein
MREEELRKKEGTSRKFVLVALQCSIVSSVMVIQVNKRCALVLGIGVCRKVEGKNARNKSTMQI